MPARTRRIRFLAAAPVLALVLAGCSGGSDGDDVTPSRPDGTSTPSASASAPAASPAGTASPTGAAATVSAAPVATQAGAKVTGASLSQRITAAAATAKTASFTVIGTGPQPTSATGVTSGTGKTLQLRMKATVSSMSQVEIIKKNGIVYLKPPAVMAQDKPWLKITESKSDSFRQFYVTLFASLEASGDVPVTAGVIGQIASFTTGPQEDVGGVPCTKYSAKPPAAIGAKLMPSSFQQLGTKTLSASTTDVSVWVDAAGRLCRTGTTLKLPKTTPDQIARQLVTYQDWGKAISVSPPPAAQVVTPTPAS